MIPIHVCINTRTTFRPCMLSQTCQAKRCRPFPKLLRLSDCHNLHIPVCLFPCWPLTVYQYAEPLLQIQLSGCFSEDFEPPIVQIKQIVMQLAGHMTFDTPTYARSCTISLRARVCVCVVSLLSIGLLCFVLRKKKSDLMKLV